MKKMLKKAGPMDWNAYLSMSDDFQREYYSTIRQQFGVTRGEIADMFQTTVDVLKKNLYRLGCVGDEPGNRREQAWEEFLSGRCKVYLAGIYEDPDVEPKKGKAKEPQNGSLQKIEKLIKENAMLRKVLEEAREVIAFQNQQIFDLRQILDTQTELCVDDIRCLLDGKEDQE